MKSIFNPDSPVMVFLGNVADMMILSLLWVVASLPVLTIGASTTALYYVLFKLADNEGVPIISTFFKAFCREFTQSSCVFLLILIPMVIIIADYLLISAGIVHAVPGFKILLGVIAALMLVVSSYVFPYIAKFQNSIAKVFINSFCIAAKNFHASVMITCINLIPFIVLYFFTPAFVMLFMFWVVIGFGLIGAINVKLIRRVFFKYLPKQDESFEHKHSGL